MSWRTRQKIRRPQERGTMRGFLRFVITKTDENGHICEINEVQKCETEQEIADLYKEIKIYSPALKQKEDEELAKKEQRIIELETKVESLENKCSILLDRIEKLENVTDDTLKKELMEVIKND